MLFFLGWDGGVLVESVDLYLLVRLVTFFA